MAKFITTVRYIVKDGCVEELVRKHNDLDADGVALSQQLIQTSDNSFCWIGVFISEEAVATVRPKLIAQLDTFRHLLEEISPELGVTDPVSGPVVWEV